ncbi:MAG: hypothetical protein NTW04_03595, partial [Elusimicrobia bacterium]|nr:hypothetical protein [Elusimicrobiota bacterium]
SHAVWVVKKRIEFDSAAPQLLMTFILSMLALWVYMLIGIIFSGEFTWRGWHYVLLTPLLNAAVSPLIFLAARRLLKEKPVFYL